MKKLFLTALLFVLTGITFSTLAQSKVQTGNWNADTQTPGYTLSTNSGDRNVIISVDFTEPFDVKPDVMLSVTVVDASSDKNVRYKVESMSVSRDGMTIKISTWADTKIYGISGYWLAHAPAQ